MKKFTYLGRRYRIFGRWVEVRDREYLESATTFENVLQSEIRFLGIHIWWVTECVEATPVSCKFANDMLGITDWQSPMIARINLNMSVGLPIA